MLVHVAVAIVGLVAFTAFAMDYGVMWLGRRQAQNAADAGALAGALSFAFDAPGMTGPNDPPKQNAVVFAQRHRVWGAPPSVTPADVTIGCMTGNGGNTCEEAPMPCDEGVDTCIRVDAFRDAAHANALPSYFAQLVGITSQDVRATATARILNGNATNCLKPWALPDKWDEFENPTEPDYPGHDPDYWNTGGPDSRPGFEDNWASDVTFDRYSTGQGPNPPQEDDMYVPPTSDDPGTGYRVKDSTGQLCCDYGKKMNLKKSVGQGDNDQISSGWFMALDLLDSVGGADYRNNIKHCNGMTFEIGDEVPLSTEQGAKVGPTDQGTYDDDDSLYNQDPTAHWDPTALGGKGAIVSDDYPAPNSSPRIVPIPVFNVDEFLATDPEGKSTVVIKNILGLFIDDQSNCPGPKNGKVCGRLVTLPGEFVQGGSTVSNPSSFLLKIQLIR